MVSAALSLLDVLGAPDVLRVPLTSALVHSRSTGAASILRLLSPSLDVQQLIAESREKEEVLYLGVKGEVRQPSSLIALREGAEAEQQRREWIPTVDELERWEERSKG